MRNPNGYGSVYKLSGNRRKPWAARITLGFKPDNGQPIYKFVCYCKTRAEAMRALAMYNGEELEANQIPTLFEVYEEWAKEQEALMKSFNQYRTAFLTFEPLFKKKITMINIKDYEEIGNKSGKTKGVLDKAKVALSGVYAYAFRKGIIDESKASLPKFIKFTNFAETGSINAHKTFTHEEVAKLWESKDDDVARIILVMIYTGMRISELAALKMEDVHLKERYFEIKASKTEAGKRKVPIADRILPIAQEWVKNGEMYFAPITKHDNVQSSVNAFRQRVFTPACERLLGSVHIPHDTRYTTATFLTEKSADVRHIKLILGHAQQDVTNNIYARKIGVPVLLETINLLD